MSLAQQRRLPLDTILLPDWVSRERVDLIRSLAATHHLATGPEICCQLQFNPAVRIHPLEPEESPPSSGRPRRRCDSDARPFRGAPKVRLLPPSQCRLPQGGSTHLRSSCSSQTGIKRYSPRTWRTASASSCSNRNDCLTTSRILYRYRVGSFPQRLTWPVSSPCSRRGMSNRSRTQHWM